VEVEKVLAPDAKAKKDYSSLLPIPFITFVLVGWLYYVYLR
jgi:hypothetical protein